MPDFYLGEEIFDEDTSKLLLEKPKNWLGSTARGFKLLFK